MPNGKQCRERADEKRKSPMMQIKPRVVQIEIPMSTFKCERANKKISMHGCDNHAEDINKTLKTKCPCDIEKTVGRKPNLKKD